MPDTGQGAVRTQCQGEGQVGLSPQWGWCQFLVLTAGEVLGDGVEEGAAQWGALAFQGSSV